MGLWRLITRGLVGALMFGHGAQKLFGWFQGGGLEETGAGMEKMGLSPGREHAIAAGAAEAAGGTLLAAGAELPIAAALLIGVMQTAIKRVHLRNGIWATRGGYEYPLVVMSVVLALTEAGAGRFSIDSLTGQERKGAEWAAFAFGAGSLGAYLVDALGEQNLPAAVEWIDNHRPHLASVRHKAA